MRLDTFVSLFDSKPHKLEGNGRVIYKLTEAMESNYFKQTLHGKLFHTNKVGLMNACFVRSIKIEAAETVSISIVSPIHNIYIYICIYIYI